MQLLYTVILALSAFAAKPSAPKSAFTREPSEEQRAALAAQFPKIFSDCRLEVVAADLAVQGEPALVTSCPSDCGRGGCPHQVFLLQNGKYHQAADFFGQWEIATTRHEGYSDIRVKSTLGKDAPMAFTLTFHGQSYQ